MMSPRQHIHGMDGLIAKACKIYNIEYNSFFELTVHSITMKSFKPSIYEYNISNKNFTPCYGIEIFMSLSKPFRHSKPFKIRILNNRQLEGSTVGCGCIYCKRFIKTRR